MANNGISKTYGIYNNERFIDSPEELEKRKIDLSEEFRSRIISTMSALDNKASQDNRSVIVVIDYDKQEVRLDK